MSDELMMEVPTLSLGDEPKAEAAVAEAPAPVREVKIEDKIQLTPEEQKMVDDFAAQIDISNTQMVLQYGAGSQKKIADFYMKKQQKLYLFNLLFLCIRNLVFIIFFS